MRLAPRELESRSLTTRTSSLGPFRDKLQDVGFEPTRFSTPRPQRGPVTTWVILLFLSDSNNNKAYYVGLLYGVLVGLAFQPRPGWFGSGAAIQFWSPAFFLFVF